MGSTDGDAAPADKPSLPKLLASLALGARAVNALPLSRANVDGDEVDDGDDGDEDEFSFRMSLPEFASLNHSARQSLSSLLCQALEGISTDDDDDISYAYEFDDPELWERCADACDALFDRVASHIAHEERKQGGGEESYDALATAIGTVAQRARSKASGAYGRMVEGLADMEKPQNVYQGFVTRPPQNARGAPFVPAIGHDGAKQAQLEGGEYTQEGHGLDTRFEGGGNGDGDGEGRDITRRKYAPDMVAPSFHYEHPYREEIEALEYRPWQLDVTAIEKADGPITIHHGKNDNGVWIGNEEELAQLAARIAEGQESGEIQEIALDLEAHSHRTFAGFVCLIQLSIRRPKTADAAQESSTPEIATGYDFLIDALTLRHAIPAHLGPMLADPNLLKVMHGADSDIPWLQRDFGCYIVNLFDTGRASRALKFPSAGLAYLMRKYAGIEADKQHQLSDWRRRPLPEDMRGYAVSDTRYLLDIYDQLRLELDQHSMQDVSIKAVLDRSKQVCLIRYDKEPFRPSGYKTIMDGGKSRRRGSKKNSKVTSELSPQQEEALKALYHWRDATARQEDESVQYVCSNSALLRIASNRPVTVAALQRLVNPLPPLVMRRSQEILNAIKASTSREASKGEEVKKATTSKSALPRPANRREMLSPILDSEALYQQAGWTTPIIPGGSSGASESEDDDGIRKFLDVNAANQGYTATQYSSHSIEMSPPSLENEADDSAAMHPKKVSRGASTDGLATARAAMGHSAGASIQEDVKVAQRSANLIKNEMIKMGEGGAGGKFGHGFSLIDLIRPMSQSEGGIDYDNSQEATDKSAGAGTNAGTTDMAPEEDEMTIPKSMKEIYSLSNANRRKTAKEKGGKKPLKFPQSDSAAKIEKFPEDEVEGADAIIASRGGPGGYFGGNGSKRQKSTPGKVEDIKLMAKMGWVKDEKDAKSLAVVPADLQGTPEKEKQASSGAQHKKSNAPRGGGASGGMPLFDAYGAGMGAFDPNAAPSKNPFFAGAAASAASMLHGESSNKGKSKRNKKR